MSVDIQHIRMKLFRLGPRMRRKVNVVLGRCEWVFGDSHTMVFTWMNQNIFGFERYIVVRVDGATALGLANPNSKTDALKLFRYEYKKLARHRTLNFLLGEVDAGFLIWYRQAKHGISIEEGVASSIDNYRRFVKEILDSGWHNIRILSIPLPIIEDYQAWEGQIANLRKVVDASKKGRTDVSLEYNRQLRQMCLELGVQFVDCTEDLLGRDGLVLPRFVNRDPLDHHLESSEYASVLLRHLPMQSSWRGV